MTLGEFSLLLNVEPKWVLNASAALGGALQYTLPAAKQLAVARALHQALGVPIPRAHELAGQILARYKAERLPVTVLSEGKTGLGDTVDTTIDVYRILAAVYTGLSRLRTAYAPRRRGRPGTARRDSVRAAVEYGLDLTLLSANLGRTHAERLRQLDAMAGFRRGVGRRPLTTVAP
ncbi:MAG: hypothetical protein H0W30_02585 [Gemmatimonadaceae bacterium]|nr:hypothetical protein [Gemmatimonadaceae bacterium]MDQ3517454.1 hypothetical protein [Gemmatimonadota bacterium]